jgi:3'-phosphoadenosine 5'-phosphosulfate sulfotransferase (PAPS reductase)/FAD synthetase
MTFTPTASDVAVDPATYDRLLIMFSAGKDSLALLLLLIEMGVSLELVELWHHDVDGREGSTLMDWPCTRDYCAKVASAFGVPIFFSWKEGGFERELLKENAPTAGYFYETPEGLRAGGGKSKNIGTRRMFPQKTADLTTRWCSAYLKIMVADIALRGQPARFDGARTLVLTGERAEESAARAQYEVFEPHRADLREGQTPRWIDHWRPIHDWPLDKVWALIAKHRVTPHPAYRLGWGRVSCAGCIFGSPAQWASLRRVNPRQFRQIARHEASFEKTIDRKLTVVQMADAGEPFEGMREADIRAALSPSFDEPIFLRHWTLPRGAHGDACGPT